MGSVGTANHGEAMWGFAHSRPAPPSSSSVESRCRRFGEWFFPAAAAAAGSFTAIYLILCLAAEAELVLRCLTLSPHKTYTLFISLSHYVQFKTQHTHTLTQHSQQMPCTFCCHFNSVLYKTYALSLQHNTHTHSFSLSHFVVSDWVCLCMSVCVCARGHPHHGIKPTTTARRPEAFCERGRNPRWVDDSKADAQDVHATLRHGFANKTRTIEGFLDQNRRTAI